MTCACQMGAGTLKELECLATERPSGGSWPYEIEFVKRGGE